MNLIYAPDQRPPRVAVVGGTIAHCEDLVRCLELRKFPLQALRCFAPEPPADSWIAIGSKHYFVAPLDRCAFDNVDVVIFSDGADLSRAWAGVAVAAGAMVVNASSAFRLDPAVPLVVPAVNPMALVSEARLTAVPSFVAAMASKALAPLLQTWSITRLSMVAVGPEMESRPGAARRPPEGGTSSLGGQEHPDLGLSDRPALGAACSTTAHSSEPSYNGEEEVVVAETRRILGLSRLPIGITCVRVPAVSAHSITVSVRFDDYVTPEQVRQRLTNAEGLRLADNREASQLPMPDEVAEAVDVFVGRVRKDMGDPSGRSVAMLLSSGRCRDERARSAVQVAEVLCARTLI